MSRIDETFAALRAAGRTGLVTYTTAGDPDLARAGDILRAAEVKLSADVLAACDGVTREILYPMG